MKTRSSFEERLNAEVKDRLRQSGKPKEEALHMLDCFCAAAYFLVGIIEPRLSGGQTIGRIVNRLEPIAQQIHNARSKPDNGAGGVEGEPAKAG